MDDAASPVTLIKPQAQVAEHSGNRLDAGVEWLSAPDVALDLNGPINRPFDRLDDNFSDLPVHEHLNRIAVRHGERVAVSDRSISLTFAQFKAAVDRLALTIAAAAPPDAPVGLLIGNSAWFPVAMFAAMRAGRVCVPLNPRDPIPRLSGLAQNAKLTVLVGEGSGMPEGWPQAQKLIWIDVTASLNGKTLHTDGRLPAAVSVDQSAIVLYTSGSTGEPKGIVNSQRNLLQRVQQYVNAAHFGPGDVFMPLTGPATIAGCRETMTPLLSGASLYFADIEGAGIRAVRHLIAAQRISIVYIVPALLRVVMKDPAPGEFDSLRLLRVGGEKVLWSDIDTIRKAASATCLIQVSYSSTETTGTQWFLPRDCAERGATAPVGYITPGIEYAVVGEDGRSVPPGSEGELLVRSNFVALGYRRGGSYQPIDTDAHTGKRVFATGDIVEFDTTDLMRVVGRKGRQVKINGRRVEPAELELVLRRADHVVDAVVITSEQNELVAFVVPAHDAPSDLDVVLRSIIREQLPPAIHPVRLHLIDAIPLLVGGKADTEKLRQADINRSKGGASAQMVDSAATLNAARAAATVWCTLLGQEPAPASRWGESGGDSLKLLQYVMELETALGRDLPLDRFTVAMQFSDIVAVAAQQRAAPTPRTEAMPTLFILPGSIGYGPSLAAFGTELAGTARAVAIEYPDLEETLAGNGTIPIMADMAVAQITAAQPVGDIRLIGYSLGGGVAFEAARRLLDMGRNIAFLGILDTNIGPAAHNYREQISRTAQRLHAHRVTLDRMLLRALDKAVVRVGLERQLARFLDGADWNWFARARFILRLELEEVLRMRAFFRWVHGPKRALPVAATLFRCHRPNVPADLGWGELFAALTILPIAGGHLDMLIEPHLRHNRPVIEAAFRTSAANANLALAASHS